VERVRKQRHRIACPTKELSFADESFQRAGKTGGKTGGKAGDSSKTQKSHSAKAGLQVCLSLLLPYPCMTRQPPSPESNH